MHALDLRQLCGEIGIFICKAFCGHYVNSHIFECLLVDFILRHHLVIVVGIKNSCRFESQRFLRFFHGYRNCQFPGDCVSEDVIPNIGNAGSCGTCPESHDFGLLGNGPGCEHLSREGRPFHRQDFVLLNGFFHGVNGFCLYSFCVICDQVDFDFGVGIFVNFIYGQRSPLIHGLSISSPRACVC